jgi:Skp family chaperone for outer membrane proteins
MKKHISQLEGEVKKKEAELNAMEKKLKNNKGRGAAMTSRDNEAAKENAKKSKSEMHKVIAQVCHTYYQISRTYLLHIRTG